MKSGRIIVIGSACDFCKKVCFLSSYNRSQSYFDYYLDGKETDITSLNLELLSEDGLYLGIDLYYHQVEPGYLMDSGFCFDVYIEL
jgi:hypothetical protein